MEPLTNLHLAILDSFNTLLHRHGFKPHEVNAEYHFDEVKGAFLHVNTGYYYANDPDKQLRFDRLADQVGMVGHEIIGPTGAELFDKLESAIKVAPVPRQGR